MCQDAGLERVKGFRAFAFVEAAFRRALFPLSGFCRSRLSRWAFTPMLSIGASSRWRSANSHGVLRQDRSPPRIAACPACPACPESYREGLVPSAAEGPLATFFQRSLPASLPPNLSTFQPSNFPTFCTAPGIACRQSPPDLHDTPTQRLSSLGGRSFSSDIRARQPKFLHLAARSAIFCVDALTHPHRPLLDRRSRPRRHRRSRPGRETRSRSG